VGDAVGTDGADFSVFEETEEFDLNFEGKVSYFVEKKCSVVSLEKGAGALVEGACESTFDMAKEFTFCK